MFSSICAMSVQGGLLAHGEDSSGNIGPPIGPPTTYAAPAGPSVDGILKDDDSDDDDDDYVF